MPRGSGLKIKRKRERFFGDRGRGETSRPVKNNLNRPRQTKQPASRARDTFQSKVRVQACSPQGNQAV